MGSASCKNSKTAANVTVPKKEEIKRISIAVFGLENAGKTATVKMLQGAAPAKTPAAESDVETSTVTYPPSLKAKDKKQERIEIIDVSGKENFREYSWADYYDRIHGFIFVVDASDKKRMLKNKSALSDLLRNSKLRDKPLLILANKQDQPNAIKDEDYLKEKLDIEDIRAPHKIVFCEAVLANKKKAASSIQEGFAWLIGEIEKDFTKLNDRVVPPKGSARAKTPMIKKTGAYGTKLNHSASDDDDLVYTGARRSTPPPSSRIGEHRSPNMSNRLPQIDLNKPKRKPGGYETYSDNDDTKDMRSRPTVSVPTSSRTERDRFGADLSLDNTLAFNKKKKVIGSTNNYHDTPGKRITDLDTKSFRSSYEPFPEDLPLSGSSRRVTKPDGTVSAGNALRIPSLNDPFKRSVSPLVHDWKSQKSDTLTKRDKGSDDDETPYASQRDKSKSLYPLSSKSRDDDYTKYTTPLSSSKPISTYKKSTSGLYGSDEEDYSRRTTSVPARLPTSTSTVGARKPYKPNDDSDNDDPYRKKSTFGASKPLGSDDDDDRTHDKYKPNDRSRFNNGYHGSATDSSMPSRLSRSPGGGNDYLSKTTPPKARFGFDDDDDRPAASSRTGNYPKYDFDDDYKSSSKPTASSRYDDHRPSSPVRNTSLSRLNDTSSRNPVSSKPPTRSTFEDDDDDEYRSGGMTKVPSRSKLNEYDDDDHRPLGTKTSSRSKFEDDDDEYPGGSDSRFRSGNNGRVGSGTTSRPRNGSMYDY